MTEDCETPEAETETRWVRCPACHTSGTPHEPNGDECRDAAYERNTSQGDFNE